MTNNSTIPADLKDLLSQCAANGTQDTGVSVTNSSQPRTIKNKIHKGRLASFSTRESLNKLIKETAFECGGEDEDWIHHFRLQEDLKKVQFGHNEVNMGFGDFEMPGFEFGFDELNKEEGLVVFWVGARGYESEIPVAFCIYMDSHGKLRAYIPTNGNCWNPVSKSSYDVDDIPNYSYNMEELRKDASARIAVDAKTVPQMIDISNMTPEQINDVLDKIENSEQTP